MNDVQKAKRSLGRQLRALDGYVGIGVGNEGIRLYATANTAPVVRTFHDRWGTTYEGFPVAIVLSRGFKAHRHQA